MTVGTTLFTALIEQMTTPETLERIKARSYDKIIVQYGKGARPAVESFSFDGLDIEVYDFKPNLTDDMQKADLIVSHAGAGTIMECLRLRKRTAVVINSILMDDHQKELANAMSRRQHLVKVDSPLDLKESSTWDAIESFQPVPFEGGDHHFFPRFLDSFLLEPKAE